MTNVNKSNTLQIEMEMSLCGVFLVEGFGMVHLQEGWQPPQLWLPFEPVPVQLRLM